jgi:hypothetical protein
MTALPEQLFGIHYSRSDTRTPVAFYQSKLQPDLLDYLQSLPVFTCKEEELESFGFQQHVDHRNKANHIYHETYFHAQWRHAHKSVLSIHPRFGYDWEKPAAPSRLVAFCEAMRRENMVWLKEMCHRLPTKCLLRKLIEQGRAFADLSIQVR